LTDVARGSGVELAAGSEADSAQTTPTPVPEAVSGNTAADAAGPDVEPAREPEPRATSGDPPDAGAAEPPEAPSVQALQPDPPAIDAGRDLAAWLVPGALGSRVRFRSADGTVLLIDPDAGSWHGPTALKSLAGCFEGVLADEDFAPLDDPAWQREAAAAGAPQPLARLRWLGGLLAGNGALLPGYAASDRFQLNKWPQTEREYPRHFRIATQMMKGPATLAEIAQASGVPEADVADFINANLATGFAEAVAETPVVVEEPVKARAGLLGRLRSR